MSFFRLAALPAREGDCLVLSYGADETSTRHIVVDGGHAATAIKLTNYLAAKGITEVELLVVTHVDADHIEGILDFLRAAKGRIAISDIWFNGWKHLREGLQGMGPAQGEALTTLIADLRWNGICDGAAIRTADDGTPRPLPTLAGGLELTVLSPDLGKLRAMERTWAQACLESGLIPGEGKPLPEPPKPGLQRMGVVSLEQLAATPTGKDTAKANGTSIALLAEFEGASVLLGADAHPDLLLRSVQSLGGGRRLKLDLFKVPHHGSQNNVTRELLAAVDCNTFLISTDGTRFNHPDQVAVARIVTSQQGPVRLMFNYRQPKTVYWDQRIEDRERYVCVFPSAEDEPLEIIIRG